ncbi:acetyl-CoA carboxylase biotin carboxyl carrier protein [Candidatus Purcelliella pentastirinorum]|uniref:Biotin carboxyl carrier protein of acetyl-CoA carboxylase n=1 Tax=Candidatus Purcelliella pentastirinorum TaxID=472834 RepID=A0A346DZF3_9ENTR|nr:acetyl-CoA carboxylase biotin carboxyl carrier protein [Candidatus Purcelliella pentastirinorum]AXN02108.1 Biotin carboxyl carrier protein of acetyl-CoA carboxylase [Candidatus Purcelliella pentastirinorum]WDI79065.1 acetyl-CoA carboxylase biotin carboxyl carrier protein [Candidatus Purcelliella pentastirinorum]WDR80203.1 acetyl-CoA carboxylase biotin carboxyl carrier protein [Candidatus Purcelliella pentastirinorum]
MDIKKINRLIKLVKKSKITELEISNKDESIRINYLNNKYLINNSDYNLYNKKNTEYKKEKKKKELTGYKIRSPMVGTFYITPNPTSKPFITIGQKINIGDTLCIIEAMKIMNHIESDKSGIIKSILIKNGQPVEFNEPLIIIELLDKIIC